MISEKSEAGVKLYEHVMSELHSCVEWYDLEEVLRDEGE